MNNEPEEVVESVHREAHVYEWERIVHRMLRPFLYFDERPSHE